MNRITPLFRQHFQHSLKVTNVRCLTNGKPWSEVPEPPGWSLLGNLDQLKKRNINYQHHWHKELKKEYGSIYKIKVFGDTYLHIHDPEDVETLLRNDGKMPIMPLEQLMELRKEYEDYFKDTYGINSLMLLCCCEVLAEHCPMKAHSHMYLKSRGEVLPPLPRSRKSFTQNTSLCNYNSMFFRARNLYFSTKN